MFAAPAPVIVIDLQTGLIDGIDEPPLHDAAGLVARARSVIAWARRNRHPVAFVRHDGPPGDSLHPGARGWPVWPALGQGPDEPTFAKSIGNAFSNPALGSWVRALGATRVILLGAQTDFCIAASVPGAMAEGFTVTVVGDAHGTIDQPGMPAVDAVATHNQRFAAAGATVTTVAVLNAG